MATEIVMIRAADGSFRPYGPEELAKCERFKVGRLVRMTPVMIRSYPFHKRWMSLANFAYDIWVETIPPIVYRGQAVQPNFERFRKDLTILAGYYTSTFSIDGEIKLHAKSISYAAMDQEEFEKLYSATINAVLAHIMTRAGRDWSEDQLRAAIEELMSYDGG